MDLDNIMKKLGKERPVFHCEADFQVALYKSICKINKETKEFDEIILEKKEGINDDSINIDILLKKDNLLKVVIELKYAPEEMNHDDKDSGEFYRLKKQPTDRNRYGFWKDVERLKGYLSEFKNNKTKTVGYVIFLTNNMKYWEKEKDSYNLIDQDYQIFDTHEKRNVHVLKFYSKAKDKPKDVNLQGYTYGPLKWNDYSKLQDGVKKNDIKFRYLLLEINNT